MMQARKRELLILPTKQYPLLILSEARATVEIFSLDSAL